MTSPHRGGGATAQARTLIEARQFRRALDVLAAALSSDPEDGIAWCLMAQCQLALEDSPRAIDAARRAVALMPESEWPHRLLSIAFMGTHAYTDARIEAERAVACAPNLWRPHTQLAKVDCAAGRIIDVTWQAARRGVELGPDESDAHFVLGYVALLSKEHSLARAAFQESLRLAPDNAVARNNLAVIDMRRRRWIRAVPHLMGALRVNPNLESSAQNLRTVLRYVCILLAPVGVIVGTVAHSTQPVVGFGQVYHGRPAGLVLANGLLIALAGGAALVLRRQIGRRFRSILAASVRIDRWLAALLLLTLGEVLFGVAATAAGFPAADALQSASMACAGAVVVVSWIIRSRARRKRAVVKVDLRQMR